MGRSYALNVASPPVTRVFHETREAGPASARADLQSIIDEEG
jgi:hypothetical protein